MHKILAPTENRDSAREEKSSEVPIAAAILLAAELADSSSLV